MCLCFVCVCYTYMCGVFSDCIFVTDRVCEFEGEGVGVALFDLLFSIVKGI